MNLAATTSRPTKSPVRRSTEVPIHPLPVVTMIFLIIAALALSGCGPSSESTIKLAEMELHKLNNAIAEAYKLSNADPSKFSDVIIDGRNASGEDMIAISKDEVTKLQGRRKAMSDALDKHRASTSDTETLRVLQKAIAENKL